MSSTIVKETWKPTCCSTLRGLQSVFQVKMDRCQRRHNHNGRCVGNFLVWDKAGIAQLRKELNP